MRLAKLLLKGIASVSFMILPLVASAQDINEAKEEFNNGATAIGENNLEQAIEHFNTCLDICYELEGEEGVEDMVLQIEEKLPKLYLQNAKNYYAENNFDKAIEQFEIASKVANNFGDTETAESAAALIPQIYNQIGIDKYKQKDFDGALDAFNKSLEVDSENPSTYYYKTLTLIKKDDDNALLETANKGIEVSLTAGDSKNSAKISSAAGKFFLKKGNDRKEASNYSEAESYLKKSLEIDQTNPTTYYLLTAVLNAQKKWDDAIKYANKGLDVEADDPSKEAKLYFELANSLKEKGDNAAACDAYKNASHGAYEEAAKYQIEYVLKCN